MDLAILKQWVTEPFGAMGDGAFWGLTECLNLTNRIVDQCPTGKTKRPVAKTIATKMQRVTNIVRVRLMNVLLTGGTGFVGKSLSYELLKRKHQIVLLSQSKSPSFTTHKIFPWTPLKGSPPRECLEKIDAVIHLAGEPIAKKRWSQKQKQKIYESRVNGTKNLVNAIEKYPNNIRSFISASAIGIYGDQGQQEILETSSFGKDFLAKVSQDWEKASKHLTNKNIRLCHARFGLILGRDGGLLKELAPIYRANMAMPLASGDQWMSWVHIKDVVGMLIYALENPHVKGAFNITAPQPVKNKQFTAQLSRAMKVFSFQKLHVPKLALKIFLGEKAEMILSSQKVLPSKMLGWDYSFYFKELKEALNDIFEVQA